MPELISGPHKFTIRPRILEDRPDHLKLIGHVAQEWSRVEYRLMQLFCDLLMIGFSRDEARVVFESVINFNARLETLGSLLEHQLPLVALEFEQDIKPALRKRAKERNTVVHGLWAVTDEYPRDIIHVGIGNRITVTVHLIRAALLAGGLR